MDLTGLVSQIEGAAKELELDRLAIERLKTRYPQYFASNTIPEEQSEETHNFALAPIANFQTLEDAILRVMKADQREWTSSELCDRMELEGRLPNPDRNLRMGRLGETLKAMVGISITQTVMGVGRRASQYRWGVNHNQDDVAA